MVEVLKTNVKSRANAKMLVTRIHRAFEGYTANFDLEDCDKILRVKSLEGSVQSSGLILLLNDLGFHAEILPE